MYQNLWNDYVREISSKPWARRPLVGSVIKEIRVDKGIRQKDMAKSISLNESTLKSIENNHQKATTVRNLSACAKELGVPIDELILLGKERDPANCFALRKKTPRKISGIRKRKMHPEEWFKSLKVRFNRFSIIPVSAPVKSAKDFFSFKLEIPPGQSAGPFQCSGSSVIGFVAEGFNIIIRQEFTGETVVTANQGFRLDGNQEHVFFNPDPQTTAVIYIITKLRKPGTGLIPEKFSGLSNQLDIGDAMLALRHYCSKRPNRPVNMNHLADLTESLDHEQLIKMSRTRKGSSVIHWEKIEDVLAGAGVSLEDFLSWAKHSPVRKTTLATALTRATIDYRTYHGLRIYSCNPPGTESDFFCGELFLDGQSGKIRHKSWERKDKAMIAISVEEGDLEVTVGKKRGPIPISKGESIYFDGDLGYILRNPGKTQVKAFLATHPAISL